MKSLILKIIKRLPYNQLRILLYRVLFNYKIGKQVTIKGSILHCRHAEIVDHATILSGNVICCDTFKMGISASILENNRIAGADNFTMGDHSRIIDHHYIDLSNAVSMGDHCWLAGRNSQIWTHGSRFTKTGKVLSVTLGSHCYIGSSVMIAPGAFIAAHNLVGLGSVINGSFKREHTIIAGNPAMVVNEDVDWRENW